MELKDMDVKELKAAAYDTYAAMQELQSKLARINDTILLKHQQQNTPQVEKGKTKDK